MDAEREKQALQEKLVRCCIWLNRFPEGVTAKNLNELVDELEQKIRALEQSVLRISTRTNEFGHAASICPDLPALPTPIYRNDANECLPVLLRLRRLRSAA
jgi:hypothetical protein